MQLHTPAAVRLVALANICARDFDVSIRGRHFDSELLHRGVLNVVANHCSAGQQRFRNRNDIDDLGAHPGFDTFGRQRKFPGIQLLESENSAAPVFAERGCGDLHEPIELAGLDRDPRLGRDRHKAGRFERIERRDAHQLEGGRQIFVRANQIKR